MLSRYWMILKKREDTAIEIESTSSHSEELALENFTDLSYNRLQDHNSHVHTLKA
jgi:hypothetical protein